jgi:hypothetical protein
LLVFGLSLQKIGLIFVRIFSEAQSERLLESHRLSASHSSWGKGTGKASRDGNEHQFEGSHGGEGYKQP